MSKTRNWYEAFKEWGNTIFSAGDFQRSKEMTIQDLKFYGKYLKKGARILDIGCGIGCTAVSLSTLGYRVTGIDNDKEVLKAVRQNAKNFGGEIEIREGDIFELDKLFAPNSFDACISGGVLEHFRRSEIRKLVKMQLKLAPFVLADMPARTRATMKHFGFTEENALDNTGKDGIYRNFWSEEEWIKNVLKGFNVADHMVKRIHESIGDFDELFVVMKRNV